MMGMNIVDRRRIGRQLAMASRKSVNSAPQPPKGEGVTTVNDLINSCSDAVGKMSTSNPHRMLIINCAYALRQITDRLADAEEKLGQLGQLRPGATETTEAKDAASGD